MDSSISLILLTVASILALLLVGLAIYLGLQLKAAAKDSARLPDALQRMAAAEAKEAELERQLREESIRAAELSTRLDEVQGDYEQLQQLHSKAQANIDQLTDARAVAQSEFATLDAKAGMLQRAVERLEAREGALSTDLERERAVTSRTQAELAQAEAQRDAAKEQVLQVKHWLETAKDSLRTSFIEAASGVFDEKSLLLDKKIKDSAEVSRAQLEATLKPFAEHVGQFQQQVGQFTENQRLDAARLEGTISKLQEQNNTMVGATESLVKALKGNSKTRGDWGEMILETVLKASGLEAGKHYEVQTTIKDEDTGANLRPDVIVSFPDNRQVAVDSKVNLVAWAAYNELITQDEQQAQAALIEHTAALRKHVLDLATKNYPKKIGSNALELTVMFVPIEGALAAALATNPTLLQEALDKRVAITSPNTLMALLKVAERMWVRDQLQKQIGVIGQEANKLVETVSAFLGDFDAIEGRISALASTYNDAKNRLYESRQSVVARTKRLVEAGARGKKQLHESIQPVTADAREVLPLLEAPADPES